MGSYPISHFFPSFFPTDYLGAIITDHSGSVFSGYTEGDSMQGGNVSAQGGNVSAQGGKRNRKRKTSMKADAKTTAQPEVLTALVLPTLHIPYLHFRFCATVPENTDRLPTLGG